MTLYIALVVTAILIHQIITTRRIMNNFDEVLKTIDTATTAVAERVSKLTASLTLTPEQQAEADAIVAHLNAIAADPTNPVPTPTPTAA